MDRLKRSVVRIGDIMLQNDGLHSDKYGVRHRRSAALGDHQNTKKKFEKVYNLAGRDADAVFF